MAQGPGWVPHLLTFQEQGLQRDDPPETTPIYTPDQKAYKCYWHKGTPLYAPTGIHVILVHHLSVPGRLGVYEVVGDGWQLNVINTNVPFRRSHGTLPPSPGRGIPPDGHARPHSHHRRHERRPHPSGPRGTGHTPGRSSPRNHRNAGARGPNSQPGRPTIPLPPPNGCRPIPHRRMLWRPHHHHPSGGPIWTPPAGTHRP